MHFAFKQDAILAVVGWIRPEAAIRRYRTMNKKLPSTVVLTATDDVSSDEVQKDERHYLNSEVNRDNGDVYLRFSSRLAMYEFAKSMLQEAAFGRGGQQEFLPLIFEGRALVSNGVRMTEDSSRIFAFYPDE